MKQFLLLLTCLILLGFANSSHSQSLITPHNANCGYNDGFAVFTQAPSYEGHSSWYWSSFDGYAIQPGSDSLTGLFSGLYTFHLYDSLNATYYTESFAIGDDLTGTVSHQDATVGSCNGAITAINYDGANPVVYQYSGDPSATSSDGNWTDLCAGTYAVIIFDAGMCAVAFNNIVIAGDGPLMSNLGLSEDVLGTCEGNAAVSPAGGTPPYAISWSTSNPSLTSWNNGVVSQTMNGLCAGTYTVTITDAAGDSITESFTITNPACAGFTAYATATNVPNSCQSGISMTVSGGTTPYTYLWSNGATGSSITNLCDATYSVIVTDANGCSSATNDIIVGDTVGQTPFVASLQFTSDSSGTCEGTATVTAAGGIPPYAYAWSTGVTTSSVEDLCAGNYNVTVIDATGDSLTEYFTITAPAIDSCAGFAMSASGAFTTPAGSCDSYVALSATGGTVPYTFFDSNNEQAVTYSGMCAGTHNFYGIDAIGCTTSVAVVITIDSSAFTLLISNLETANDSSGLCTGTAAVAPQNGLAPYAITWSTGENTTVIDSLCAGIYSVIIADANGDSITETFVISDPGSTYGNLPYGDTNIVGTIYFDLIENCDIDYSSIDSASLYAGVLDTVSENLFVTWAIYSTSDTVFIFDTISFNGGNGVYNLTISVFCPQKSNENYFTIIGQIYIQGNQNVAALQESQLLWVTAYPNPFNDVFTVRTVEPGDYVVTLSDALGRIIQLKTFEQTAELAMESIPSLARGNYFLTIEGQGGKAVVKLMH